MEEAPRREEDPEPGRKYICVCLCDTSSGACGTCGRGSGVRAGEELLEPSLLTWWLQFMCVPLKNSHTTHTHTHAGTAIFANSFGHCLWRHLGVKLCCQCCHCCGLPLSLTLSLPLSVWQDKIYVAAGQQQQQLRQRQQRWPIDSGAFSASLPAPCLLCQPHSGEPTLSNLNKHLRCVKLALSIH